MTEAGPAGRTRAGKPSAAGPYDAYLGGTHHTVAEAAADGLPIQDNTHQVVQRTVPQAYVIYVDIEPRTAEYGQRLLTDTTDTCGVARRP